MLITGLEFIWILCGNFLRFYRHNDNITGIKIEKMLS